MIDTAQFVDPEHQRQQRLMAELRAAAEKTKREAVLYSDHYVKLCVDHVIATVSDDDDEPVTVESVTAMLGPPTTSTIWYRDNGTVILRKCDGSLVIEDADDCVSIDIPNPTNRQLRLALELCGIEVTQ